MAQVPKTSDLPRSPRPLDRKAIAGWCLYDVANSAFATLIVTFVYAAFFTSAFFEDENLGAALWARGVTITAVSVALLSPLLGAVADRGGYRKLLLGISTVISVGATAALYFVVPPDHALIALAFVVAGNIAFEMGLVFYNAFLPDLAPREVIGRISGIGWSAGYLGGIAALVLALGLFVLPEEPAFGVSKDNYENIRATCVLVALWFGVLSIPMFLWVKEDKSAVGTGGRSVWSAGWIQLKDTLKELRNYRQIVRFLVARLFYNDGLVTIFAFGGIYFNATFPSDNPDDAMTRLIAFGILLNVTAGIGAFAFGFIDDKIGSKPTIMITIVCLALSSAAALWTRNETVFWIAGALLGIFVGPNQAASRTLMGRFVPPDKENEFFGFFAFSGKATAFMGPFLFSVLLASLTGPFGAQGARSTAMSVTIVFFLIGGLLLLAVDEKEGIEAAHRDD